MSSQDAMTVMHNLTSLSITLKQSIPLWIPVPVKNADFAEVQRAFGQRQQREREQTCVT